MTAETEYANRTDDLYDLVELLKPLEKDVRLQVKGILIALNMMQNNDTTTVLNV